MLLDNKIMNLTNTNPRVVITGMGIYSCIGTTLDEVKNSLYQGKSGIVFDPDRENYGFRSALTGQVPRPDLKSLLHRRQLVSIGEETEYAYMATLEAHQMEQINPDFFNSQEEGLIFGNDSDSKAVLESTNMMRVDIDNTLI